MEGLVCGVDLETTGLDSEKCYITELGAILFDGQTWEPVAEFQTFIREPAAIPLSEEIKALTHISDDDIRGGKDPLEALGLFETFSKGCKAWIAHNKEFEKKFIKTALGRYKYTPEHEFMNRPWVCSKDDIEHKGKSCTKLSHLAVDYGCTVDGSGLHRAVNDVRLMGQMLKKIGRSADEIKAYALEPWVYIKALVSFNDKELAKKDGYSWERRNGDYNGPIFQKSWIKKIKLSQWEAEKARSVDFKRVRVEPDGQATPST